MDSSKSSLTPSLESSPFDPLILSRFLPEFYECKYRLICIYSCVNRSSFSLFSFQFSVFFDSGSFQLTKILNRQRIVERKCKEKFQRKGSQHVQVVSGGSPFLSCLVLSCPLFFPSFFPSTCFVLFKWRSLFGGKQVPSKPTRLWWVSLLSRFIPWPREGEKEKWQESGTKRGV